MKMFGKKCRKDKNRSEEGGKKNVKNTSVLPGWSSASVQITIGRDGSAQGVIICGAKSFVNYLPELITVNIGKNNVDVIGTGLECSTFCGGCVELFGTIEEIKFR